MAYADLPPAQAGGTEAEVNLAAVLSLDEKPKPRSLDPLLDGDADIDGDVDLGDYSVLANSYGVPVGAKWTSGDFDIDGDVDLDDFGRMQNNFGLSSISPESDVIVDGETDGQTDGGGDLAVPAPTAMLLGALGLTLVAVIKRRW